MSSKKMRGIRIDEETWMAAADRAALEERTVSNVIRVALRQYAEGRYDAIEKRKVEKR